MPGGSGESTQNQTPQSLFHDEEKEIVTEQTVQFQEDGSTELVDERIAFNPDFLKTGEDGLVNNVINFLERPVVVSEFTWLNSAPVLSELSSLNFPSVLLSRAMQQQKIAGFRYFRADLVVRVQVNAQPFNAGRLIVYWSPFNQSQSVVPSNLQHLGGITGYRHVDLDVAESTAVEIRIPYMSPLAYTDLISGFGEMGTMKIIVYSKLTGGDDVEATTWAHFENIRLEMPTGMPLHAFTNPKIQGTPSVGGKDSIHKKPANADKIKEKKKGDFQTLFDAQTKVADKMSGVPVIGEIAGAIKWFTEAASFVSGMFGWSRPTNPEFETPVSIKFLRNFANFNGNTLSKPLSLDARNEITLPKGAMSSELDEMCFAHVLAQPVFTDSFQMSTGNTPNTLLWKWPVHPASCLSILDSGVVTRSNTYLSFVSDLFTLWRGGICYHFKVVKTPFHSGRIRLTFVPGALYTTDYTTIDKDKCFTQVVDLRDANKFDFEIPFVSNRLWNDVVEKAEFTDDNLMRSKPTGMLYIEVLNTLKAAGQAETHIEFIVESCAGPDFQFAELKRQIACNILETIPTPRPKVQIAFFPSKDVEGYYANTVSTGEVVTSFRQILKRYCQMSQDFTPTPTTELPLVYLFPYDTGSYDSAVKDLYSYVSHIYRVYSGSMRLVLTPKEQITTVRNFLLHYADDSLSMTRGWSVLGIPNASDDSEMTRANPIGKLFPSEEFVEFDIPWYQPMSILPTGVGQIPSSSYASTVANKIPQNSGSYLKFTTGSYAVSRSIGEDFNFGYLIGPPVTTYTNPT